MRPSLPVPYVCVASNGADGLGLGLGLDVPPDRHVVTEIVF